jgi:hypothetical protein
MTTMRVFSKLNLALAAVLVISLVAAGCNGDTDDPGVSENQIYVAAVVPPTACVDSDGTESGGDPPVMVIVGTEQTFTFQSRVRGTSTGATWSDAILTSVDVSYTMNDGGTVPSRTDPCNIVIKANANGATSLTTVPAAVINEFLYTPGRLGKVTLRFKGHDAGGEPIDVDPIEVPLQTVNVCGVAGS